MQWDGEDPAKRHKERDRAVKATLLELSAYSPFYASHLRHGGVNPHTVSGLADLQRLAPVEWAEVADDPARFVVQPTEAALARSGDRRTVLTVAAGKFFGRAGRLNRHVIEPRFKPIHWHLDDGVPVGSTAADLDRLGEMGARMFSVAGLDRNDVVANLTEPGPRLAYWQSVLGARTGGLTSISLGPAADAEILASAAPTALVGEPRSVLQATAGLRERGLAIPDLGTVILTGTDPDAATRDAVSLAVREVAGTEPVVVAAWAPPGVRAMWIECPDGDGFHTYPDVEVLEVGRGGAIHPDGLGELVWSGLGWHGTALFRLRTGTVAEVEDATCPACGRKGPVVFTGTRDAVGPIQALAEQEAVTAFQIELRDVDGNEELLVFLALARDAELAPVLRAVDPDLAATQYVVLPARQVEAKVRAAGSRVVDERILS